VWQNSGGHVASSSCPSTRPLLVLTRRLCSTYTYQTTSLARGIRVLNFEWFEIGGGALGSYVVRVMRRSMVLLILYAVNRLTFSTPCSNHNCQNGATCVTSGAPDYRGCFHTMLTDFEMQATVRSLAAAPLDSGATRVRMLAAAQVPALPRCHVHRALVCALAFPSMKVMRVFCCFGTCDSLPEWHRQQVSNAQVMPK
jgi:hypothetical protein